MPEEAACLAILKSMDEWLTNDEGLMIEDVVEWRNALAEALGCPKDDWFAKRGWPDDED